MAGYTLKTFRDEFREGKNILASQHVKFVNGGITLDADAIGAEYLEVGTAVARNTVTGKYEVYADGDDAGAAVLPDGFDDFVILNVPVEVDGENDVIVGEAIVNGDVYDAKLPDNVTDVFKQVTRHRIRYVKHI